MTGFLRFGVLAVLGIAATPGVSHGQAAVDLHATVPSEPVRVGETFLVQIQVRQGREGEVTFPDQLPLPEHAEQSGPVQVLSESAGRVWTAEYTLIAWQADTVKLDPVEVVLDGAGGVTRQIEPLPVLVASVIPPVSEEPLELRDARGFLSEPRRGWWMAGILAGLAALAWLAWRRFGQMSGPPPIPRDPGEEALGELERLRASWVARRVTAGRFYDRYESTLHRWAGATRDWGPTSELQSLVERGSPLLSSLRRSVFARFGRLQPEHDAPLDDIAVGAEFLKAEMAAARAPAMPAASEPVPATEQGGDLIDGGER